jgi:hypothetical protein
VCKTPGTPVPKPPYYCWPVCPGPVTGGRAQDTRHLQAEQRIAPHWDCSTQVCCCCRCYTWPVGSPPLQQISHGKLHTGHSRTGRHCRATPLDAAAATQDHQVLSQNKRAGEHEQRRHPQSQHVTRCETGTVTKQGTKAQKAAPLRLASPKLHTHDPHWKKQPHCSTPTSNQGKDVGSSGAL